MNQKSHKGLLQKPQIQQQLPSGGQQLYSCAWHAQGVWEVVGGYIRVGECVEFD